MVLAQRVAVVTGASRGIGRAIAVSLAAEGAAVLVNYTSNEAAAQAAVDEITASGGRAAAFRADVSQASQAEDLVKAAQELYGRVDILVNNAGVARDNLLMRMKENDWDSVVETNLKGVFNCTKAVARTMLKQKHGRIINISSVVALTGNPGQANYCAAKAGIIGFSKSVARELGSRGITCNTICPGYIETDMTRDLPEESKQAIVAQIPLGRVGSGADVAKAVVFLAGPGGEYITGQTLCVDGGMTMQ